jgi:hypothetical protein
MKRYSLAVVLGLTVMLLALAPQLRADGTDHFTYDHGNVIVATHSSHADSDSNHDWNTAEGFCSSAHSNPVKLGSSSGSNGGSNANCSTGMGGSTSSTSSTPEPSSLVLLLSGLMAAAAGLTLKKVLA